MHLPIYMSTNRFFLFLENIECIKSQLKSGLWKFYQEGIACHRSGVSVQLNYIVGHVNFFVMKRKIAWPNLSSQHSQELLTLLLSEWKWSESKYRILFNSFILKIDLVYNWGILDLWLKAQRVAMDLINLLNSMTHHSTVIAGGLFFLLRVLILVSLRRR